MTHIASDRLSGYLDGDLGAAEREVVERHMAACAACAGMLAELGAVRRRAASLEPVGPTRDLWPGIAARLAPRAGVATSPVIAPGARSPRHRRRTFAFNVPQLAATAVALTAMGALAAWLTIRQAAKTGMDARVAEAPAVPSANAEMASLASLPAGAGAIGIERAVADMQALFATRRAELDPATIAVIASNLAIIDAAVAEVRHALEQDPASLYLNRTLAAALRRKLDVLTAAATAARL